MKNNYEKIKDLLWGIAGISIAAAIAAPFYIFASVLILILGE